MATENIDTRWAHRILQDAISHYPDARGSSMPSACKLLFELSFSFTTLQNTPEVERTRQKALDHALYAWYEHTKRRTSPVKPRELRMLMSWLMYYHEPQQAITGLIFIAKGIRRLHAVQCSKNGRLIAFKKTEYQYLDNILSHFSSDHKWECRQWHSLIAPHINDDDVKAFLRIWHKAYDTIPYMTTVQAADSFYLYQRGLDPWASQLEGAYRIVSTLASYIPFDKVPYTMDKVDAYMEAIPYGLRADTALYQLEQLYLIWDAQNDRKVHRWQLNLHGYQQCSQLVSTWLTHIGNTRTFAWWKLLIYVYQESDHPISKMIQHYLNTQQPEYKLALQALQSEPMIASLYALDSASPDYYNQLAEKLAQEYHLKEQSPLHGVDSLFT